MALSRWLAAFFGDSRTELPENVPEGWVRQLERLLAPVDEPKQGPRRPGLARDILAFVLTGEPLSILHEVGQNKAVGNQLQLLGPQFGSSSFPDLYKEFNQVPATIALRWARVLEASASSAKAHFTIALPRGVNWPQALLLHGCGVGGYGFSAQPRQVCWLSAQQMESLLVEDGLEASALLVGTFATPPHGFGAQQRLQLIMDLAGYPESLERHVEAIRPLLLPAQIVRRLLVLELLQPAHSETLDKLAPQLCELATSSSKQVRSACEPLLKKCSKAIFAPLRALATDGKPDQRVFALRAIAMLATPTQETELLSFARATAAADKAPSVQALLREWEFAEAATNEPAPRYEYTVPIINWDPAANRLPPQLLSEFWRKVNASIDAQNTHMRAYQARVAAAGNNFPLRQTPQYTRDDESALKAYLDSDQRTPPRHGEDGSRRGFGHVAEQIITLAAAEGATPVAIFKMLLFFNVALGNDGALQIFAGQAFNKLHERTGRPTLLELAQMLQDAGLSSAGLLLNYCIGWGQSFMTDWPDEDLWPYFAHHIDLLVRTLSENDVNSYAFDRSRLFRAFATLPAPPPEAINALFTLALGSAKTDRRAAQEALRLHPGKERRIIEALADSKAETRAVAAQWLGRLRCAAAASALETAVASEKNDFAKGALLDALEALGHPVEKYLKRDSLLAEARKLLAKGLPKELDWFPWDVMPRVRWSDNAETVPPEVLQWMLAQAVKQRLPEPNAVLRKYCAMFDARDREAFGQFVLEIWLREDIRPITPDDAMARARTQANSTHQIMAHHPQAYANTPYVGKSVEELTTLFYPGLARQPAGSAIGSKGVLAVAAACAAERAAAPTQRYLKEWYGTRAAQGKALITMLAWIEHPSATQLMLAVGSRFRTKSFQEEATRQAEALAERKGWTLAELADRTVPSAGFDETGTLELSYGTRAFIARLLPDFKIELFNPDGKKITALPEPRQDDDAEAASTAKKTFSSAKKEIKSVVQLQTDRLYEALCTERQWSYADWSTYLQQHPVLRHLAQRLVWAEVLDGKTLRAFRPLEDGTLTDREDNEVRIAADARIQVAHDSLLTAEEVAAWQQHLADYEITPLFQQLGKGVYSLPPELAKAFKIGDFEGHVIEAFALRGRALKLGYMRGPTGDGGWFFSYAKRFPTLGLQAVLEFSGNGLPEENRTVALIGVGFAGSDGAAAQGRLQLSKVPRTLLSECYNDLRLIAAEGKGFDPDWQKKVEY